MKSTHATKYEMVYSTDRRNIISSTQWRDVDNPNDYEAAAVKIIYSENGISSKDMVINESLWTDVELSGYYEIALNKRRSL